MSKPYVLHILTPGKNVSPFDVNMAYDAGWQAVHGYCGIDANEITGLVQDAIFSRGPKGVKRTGIFIGGRDAGLSMDMLQTAREAMVPPFEVSVFADPSGAFTTAAALVAKVEQALHVAHHMGMDDLRCLVFGGTGPVGTAAAVLAAKAGAHVTIVSHSSLDAAQAACDTNSDRYGVRLDAGDGSRPERKRELLHEADLILAVAKAGVEVVSLDDLALARRLKVVADVNAVPPAGVSGVAPHADGVAIAGAVEGAIGVGALAVGALKYRVQHELLIQMRESDQALDLHFGQAFEMARRYVQ